MKAYILHLTLNGAYLLVALFTLPGVNAYASNPEASNTYSSNSRTKAPYYRINSAQNNTVKITSKPYKPKVAPVTKRVKTKTVTKVTTRKSPYVKTKKISTLKTKSVKSSKTKSKVVKSKFTRSKLPQKPERTIFPDIIDSPPEQLEKIQLKLSLNGTPRLASLPNLNNTYAGKQAAMNDSNEFIFFSIKPKLQQYVKSIVEDARAPHVAVVAMDPRTGAILAIADKSTSIKSLATHSGFPAASIFKIITTAAAMEKGSLNATSPINFRGGQYTLERWNYIPDAKRDRNWMNLETALAKSCNPAFGRVALLHLNTNIVSSYAKLFGFNVNVTEELPIAQSAAFIPMNDYEFSRTAAGFGDVTLSPIHAAALISSIANGGLMPRPSLIEQVVSSAGKTLYKSLPQTLVRTVQPQTAQRMLEMMESTTLIGTSRREFTYNNKPRYPGLHVAAKTGTLKGTSPEGLNNWFVATAPIEAPKIAVAVIVVSDGYRHTKAAELGRKVITRFLQ